MSDIIRLLPDSVANQIAAGEVIQRPSSVIKELVENAVDAGATKIQVLVTDAGKSCIQVVDNGKGMSETDARLAFERHATSKISKASDLFELHTMGFRGEALASIAAVAQVELHTKMKGQELGVSISIEGSKVKEQEPISCPVGANFSVRNLFFNIPARRKFLKSNQTEMGNILSEFERIALAHPDLSFSLHSGGNLVLDLPAGNFRQRIIGIFGKRIDASLLQVEVETPLARIHGFVGTPQSSKKKNAYQYFFANGRYMRHPYFAKAVQNAYDRLIPEGEQVPFFLCFEVDPSHIDVNIHPAKTEIKFQDEQALWPILLAAVRESLGRFNAVPTLDFDTENRPDIPVFNPSASNSFTPPSIHVNPSFNPFDGGEKKRDRENFPWENKKKSGANSNWQALYDSALGGGNDTSRQEEATQPGNPNLYDTLEGSERAVWDKTSTPVFQFRGRYIVTYTEAGLVLIDQHRAHVRILYDEYMLQLSEHKGISQGLLFPQMLQLSPSSATRFEEISDKLSALGFDFSPLGGGSYSILGIPAGTEGIDPLSLVQGILDDASDGGHEAGKEIGQTIALSLARKAAIPVGQALSDDEMSNIVEKLFESTNPNLTPDGKSVQLSLGNAKIDDLFD